MRSLTSILLNNIHLIHLITQKQKNKIMATTKPAAPAAKKTSSVGIKDAIWVIAICAVIAFLNFFLNFGQSANFEGGDPAGSPLNIWGTIYKGGVIVPVIHTLLLTVIFMAIERVLALSKCIGKEKLAAFLAKIKACSRGGYRC